MKTKILIIVIVIFLSTTANAYQWSEYKASSTRSNYFSGIGNMTYPEVSYFSNISSFSEGRPYVVVGNVNEDIYPEIVATSPKDNSMYVFDRNLHLLWSFTEKSDTFLTDETIQAYKSTALLLSDINNDGYKEILFSMCDSKSIETTLHVFDGKGGEIWKKRIPGRIPPAGILVGDFNDDGEKEILIASKSIYIFDSEGTQLNRYSEKMDDEYGFSGVSYNDGMLFAMLWHYPTTEVNYSGAILTDISFRPINSYMKIEYFSIYKNLSLEIKWEKEMESSLNPTTRKYNDFYVSEDFTKVFLTHRNGFVVINTTDGSEINECFWISSWSCGIVQDADKSFWTSGTKLFMYTDKINWQYADTGYLGALTVYDVDGNDKPEVIVSAEKGNLLFFDAETGKEESVEEIYGFQSEHPSLVLIHSDIDNDGNDEIVSVESRDPGYPGRIVIIDSGTPPSTEEPETSTNNLMFTGIGAGAIVISVAAVWIWRKRRDEN